jgi:hypothetical protein
MTPPKFLYKYQAFDDQGWENLQQRQVWFSKPIDLNDPWDCAILPPVQPCSDHEWSLEYLRARSYFQGLGKGMLAAFESIYTHDLRPNNEFKKLIIKSCEQLFFERRTKIMNTIGVACFSEENNNLLMWSHYGRAHTGFCIEFDTSCETFGKQIQVEYSKNLPSVNPIDISLNPECPMREMLGTKADCWAYEKEWRLVNLKGDTAARLDPGCITGVYFGLRTQPEQKARVMAILQGTPAKFHDMVKSETMFKLETRPASAPC